MNELEIKILNFIKNRGSFENPVPLKRLKSEFNISERGVKEQILTSQKTVTAITSVDLAEYWKGWQA